MARRPRADKVAGAEGSAHVALFIECCYACGSLINRLTPWMVSLQWGSERVELDEIPIQAVATIVRSCHSCYRKLVEDGMLDVVRGKFDIRVTAVVRDGSKSVRHDKLILAWANRRLRKQ